MRIASFPTLALAFLLAGPALWHGFVAQDLDRNTALVRLLIAIPLAAVMLTFLGALTRSYRTPDVEEKPLRVKAVTGEPLKARRSTDRAERVNSDGS